MQQASIIAGADGGYHSSVSLRLVRTIFWTHSINTRMHEPIGSSRSSSCAKRQRPRDSGLRSAPRSDVRPGTGYYLSRFFQFSEACFHVPGSYGIARPSAEGSGLGLMVVVRCPTGLWFLSRCEAGDCPDRIPRATAKSTAGLAYVLRAPASTLLRAVVAEGRPSPAPSTAMSCSPRNCRTPWARKSVRAEELFSTRCSSPLATNGNGSFRIRLSCPSVVPRRRSGGSSTGPGWMLQRQDDAKSSAN